jgi:penicillin-binding protein 1A
MGRAFPVSNTRRIWSLPFRLPLFLGLVAIQAVGMAGAGTYLMLSRDLPPIPPFGQIRFDTVSTVRAAHGQVLSEMFEERRYLVPRDGLPDVLVNAVLASEDERFFQHAGTDLRAILRAIWINLRTRSVREGASTITQQLARSLLLTRERSIERKVREAIVARRLEDIYTKDQILLLYLNLIFLGEGAYGVQAASRVYFGKDVAELSAAEAATIAVLPQSPGSVTPIRDPDETGRRRDHVLRRMHLKGMLSSEALDEALATEVQAVPGRDNLADRAPVPAMEAMAIVRPWLHRAIGGDLLTGEGGVSAVLTLDLGLHLQAELAAIEAATTLSRRQGFAGPLANLAVARWDEFLRRNSLALDRDGIGPDLPEARQVPGLVTRVSAAEAQVAITPELRGVLPLDQMAWAIPYTEFPRAKGKSRPEIDRVSLDGRVKSVDLVLKAGDVVLVRRAKEPPPKARRKGKTPAPPLAEPRHKGLVLALDQFPVPQAALLAMEPRSGSILAMVGTTDFDRSQVDRTKSLRQSGSTIKPVYYSKAYDLGVAPSTILTGVSYREGEWSPEGGKTAQDMTLYEALTRSENRVSMRVFRMVIEQAGLEGLNEWAHRLGLSRPFLGYTPEALGADATPTELLQAYATIGNRGISPNPVLVREVRDAADRLLVDARSPRDPGVPLLDALSLQIATPSEDTRRAVTPEVAWLTAHNLRSVAESGTARSTRSLGRPVCGKTGTLPYDVWFIGWTPEVAAVSWVGMDTRSRYLGRSKSSGRVFGADTALPAWLQFMTSATDGLPVRDDLATPPAGVIIARIDPATGLLARAGGIEIPHLAGTEPTELSPDPDWRPAVMETAWF